MDWLSDSLDNLARSPLLGSAARQRPATEPTAMAALALSGHQRPEAALVAARWLMSQQALDGSVGIREGEPEPRWPTSLALLVWSRCRDGAPADDSERLATAIKRGLKWLLECKGHALAKDANLGHDTSLVAWPWVEGTHSWIEPTALSVLALKASGRASHSRTREAVRLLIDRLLPDGGANYGNTVVLGQVLRPHLLPTGLALCALAGEDDSSGRIAKSLRLLRDSLSERTPVLSLAWSVLGLAAHRALPGEKVRWLDAAARRATRDDENRWRMALLCLAALGGNALGTAVAATPLDRAATGGSK